MTAALAERVGFEPTEPFGSTVFKTAAIDHSATAPDRSGSRPDCPPDQARARCAILSVQIRMHRAHPAPRRGGYPPQQAHNPRR